jgi:hypothetical protein
MNRPRHAASRKGRAWLLFLLSLVAVAAPAWTDAYVCPMAREALREHRASCCAKAESVRPAASGERFEVACHCPKLAWSATPAQVREDSASDQATPILAPSPDPIAGFAQRIELGVPRSFLACESGPPLWVRNLSIRC